MKKILLILLLLPVLVKAQIITTVAGNGGTVPTPTGDGGPATNASIIPLCNVFDKFGNMYVVCNTVNAIRKISPEGIITMAAGDSTWHSGYSGDNGLAIGALLSNPAAIAVDTFGNFYFCDAENNRVRKVTVATGIITTIAGDGTAYFHGDGGPAVNASLTPFGLCLDLSGNIYVADYENGRIRKIDASGTITTIAGNGTAGSPVEGARADTSKMYAPTWLCSDMAGNLYFTDDWTYRIYKIDLGGIIHIVAGNGVAGFSGDAGPATLASINPHNITCDKTGNVYLSESVGSRVRMINTLGIINTIAGTGTNGFNGDSGLADTTELSLPAGTATDSCGNLYICDWVNRRVRKVAFNPACWAENVQSLIITPGLNIYPNPAYNELNITCPDNIDEVALTNLTGQTVHINRYNSTRVQLDVSGLPAGVYFVKVNGTEVRKFVKE